jgi:putative N6-adenine-specific DNA methylase
VENIFDISSTILITCPKRIGAILAKEVEEAGFQVKELMMGAETQGTMRDCIALNLSLRTAHRVLFLLKKFYAKTPEELYRKIMEIEWEKYLDPDGYFSVISFVDNEAINDTRFASLKCKDAIADRMMQAFKRRPDSGPDKHKAVINLHWRDNEASIYIDTSGETIAKHGYRKIPFRAPLQETLAAAIIKSTKWTPDQNFINPMCGSGTLAIEAAMIATGRYPGLLRSNFSFMHITGFDSEVYETIRKEVRAKAISNVKGRIIASDNDPIAIDAAKRNTATAGMQHIVEYETCDFQDAELPEGGGVVIFNPEYGERLGDESELEAVYKSIGDFFKQKCKGYTGYIFTGNMNLAKKVGLKSKRRIEFYNGQIDCRLIEFELYEGSKREKPAEDNKAQ